MPPVTTPAAALEQIFAGLHYRTGQTIHREQIFIFKCCLFLIVKLNPMNNCIGIMKRRQTVGTEQLWEDKRFLQQFASKADVRLTALNPFITGQTVCKQQI